MFLFHHTDKPVIVTIHGFGKRLHTEFDPLAQYFKERKYEVIQFDIYDINNPDDADYLKWMDRCEKKFRQIKSTHEHVVLIGFSMGGVIASYLASIYNVDCLILSAPAFQYLNAQKITEYGLKALQNLRNNDNTAQDKPSPKQVSAFQDIVSHYKNSIAQVNCPVLLLHGTNDEVIPISSSRDAFNQIKGKKRMLLFEGGKHRMLYDNTLQDTIFPIIELMIENKLR